MAEPLIADRCEYMTALLEYLNLACDAWEAKLLHAKKTIVFNLPYALYCPMCLS